MQRHEVAPGRLAAVHFLGAADEQDVVDVVERPVEREIMTPQGRIVIALGALAPRPVVGVDPIRDGIGQGAGVGAGQAPMLEEPLGEVALGSIVAQAVDGEPGAFGGDADLERSGRGHLSSEQRVAALNGRVFGQGAGRLEQQARAKFLFRLHGFVEAARQVIDQPEHGQRHQHDGPEHEQQRRPALLRPPEGRADSGASGSGWGGGA